MLTLLSPSKSISSKAPPIEYVATQPLFPDVTGNLLSKLRSLSFEKLEKELQVSSSLARLNYERYQKWDEQSSKPAVWLYSGDVYNGLDSFSLTKEDVSFAQNNIGIISGLYGFVRPLDAIKPYRLEMKLNFKGTWGDNLYEAWQDVLKSYFKESGTKTILMCASKEYAKAVTASLPKGVKVVTPRFMQETDDGLKEKGLFAKYSRGALARWVIENKVSDTSALKNYEKDGFKYNAELSSDAEVVFLIPRNFTLKGRFVKK